MKKMKDSSLKKFMDKTKFENNKKRTIKKYIKKKQTKNMNS